MDCHIYKPHMKLLAFSNIAPSVASSPSWWWYLGSLIQVMFGLNRKRVDWPEDMKATCKLLLLAKLGSPRCLHKWHDVSKGWTDQDDDMVE